MRKRNKENILFTFHYPHILLDDVPLEAKGQWADKDEGEANEYSHITNVK